MNSSPAYFQRLLDFVLREIRRVYVYIDDVVISVQTHEENLTKLIEVFDRFRLHNLKVKPNKCYYYAKGARTLIEEEECSRRRSNEN